MTIYVDQSLLLKGNVDVTDEGQARLHKQLRDQENERRLMGWFPELFQTSNQIQPQHSSTPHITSSR